MRFKSMTLLLTQIAFALILGSITGTFVGNLIVKYLF